MDDFDVLECVMDGYSPCSGEVVIRALGVAYEIPAYCDAHWDEVLG